MAWHHAGRGNRPGFERQLAKAARRPAVGAPTHRGVDIADLLTQIESASFATLVPVRVNRSAQTPMPKNSNTRLNPTFNHQVEEEKQPEGDEQRAAHDPEHRVLIA